MPSDSCLSVLVVEGCERSRGALRTLINEEHGLCLAAEAQTGAAALDSFIRHRPDIVMVGVCLPDVSGLELVKRIRQTDARCVLILVGTWPDPFVEKVGRLLGATEVCHKGSGLNRIREVLRGRIQASSAQRLSAEAARRTTP